MAGVFDSLMSDDPREQAYMALAAGLLSGRGNFNKVAGEALMGSQNVYRQAQEAKARQQQQALQQQMLQMQLDEAKKKSALEEANRNAIPELIASFPQAQVVQGPPTESGSYPMRQAGPEQVLPWALKALPVSQQLAQLGFNSMEKMDARQDRLEAARQAQQVAIEAKAEQERLKREEEARRNEQEARQREFQIRLAASLRPPPQEQPLEMVLGPDGKTPILLRRKDAVGKQAWVKPGAGGATDAGSDAAKQQAALALDELKAAYQTLDQKNAIPSTKRGPVENAMSWVASTTPGQIAGRIVATPEQTERDFIAGSKRRLLTAIQQATGIKSTQLNSNFELQNWLDALSNPSQSIETVERTLESVQRFIDSGGAYSERKASGVVGNQSKLSPAEQKELEELRKRFNKP